MISRQFDAILDVPNPRQTQAKTAPAIAGLMQCLFATLALMVVLFFASFLVAFHLLDRLNRGDVVFAGSLIAIFAALIVLHCVIGFALLNMRRWAIRAYFVVSCLYAAMLLIWTINPMLPLHAGNPGREAVTGIVAIAIILGPNALTFPNRAITLRGS